MDSDRLDELLQKYWNTETSLEEEQQLLEFFAREPVPENLKETAALFRYFERQKKIEVGDLSFDKNLKKKLEKGKVISISFPQIARIAAGLLVVVAATFFVRQEIRKAYPDEPEDTYSDPKVAFEETKKALMMISKSFNQAQKEASRINVFNEATEKVQNLKPSSGEKKVNEKNEKKTNI